MAVTLEGISISAACPGDVATSQNVRIEGRADYDLVNDGGGEALVDILAELVDSDGNSTADSQTNHVIAAGGRESVHHALSLATSYERPGRGGVTCSPNAGHSCARSPFGVLPCGISGHP